MDMALEKTDHIILGKPVQLKRALTKEQSRLKLLDEKKRKLFLIKVAKETKNGKKNKINF